MLTENKVKYDTLFDSLFYSQDFKDFCIDRLKICPAGLTIDTIDDYDDEMSICFKVCRKEYGYDYTKERVIGDYKIEEVINDYRFVKVCLEYLYKHVDTYIYEMVRDKLEY